MILRKSNRFKRKKLLKYLLKLSIFSCFIFILIKIYITTSDNLKKQNELQIIDKKLVCINNENENLKNQLLQGLTDDYVEKRARSSLNMIKKNERVFYNVTVD